jgi:hypothetical protein
MVKCRSERWERLPVKIISFFTLCLMVFLSPVLMSSEAFSAEALNVRLLGHSDLQGREALQVVLKSNYAYVGHHRGEEYNPLTGKVESNGTTILDISGQVRPKIITFPGHQSGEPGGSGG